MQTATQLSHLRAPGTQYPTSHETTEKLSHCVGESPIQVTGMTGETAARLKRAGKAMERWYARYQESGDPLYLDVAHFHLTRMRQMAQPLSTTTEKA